MMFSPAVLALIFGPIAAYLAWVGSWHARRSPVVVSGPFDAMLLALAVSGLVLAGPLGRLAERAFFSDPTILDRAALVSGYLILCGLWARRAGRRLVVYGIARNDLTVVLNDVLPTVGGDFERTMTGYEEAVTGRILTIEVSPRLQTAVIEIHGPKPEGFADVLTEAVRADFVKHPRPSRSKLSKRFLTVAVVAWLPVAFGVLNQTAGNWSPIKRLIARIFGQ